MADEVIDISAGKLCDFVDATKLCTAAYMGDVDTLRQLVQSNGISINSADYDKRTPLHLGASEGHLNLVELMVNTMDAYHSPLDRFGGTPLDDAIRHKHHEVERFLRSTGAVHGTTAVMMSVAAAAELCQNACAGNTAELLRLVREERIFVDACDYDKRTALHLAASEGHLSVVKLLVDDLGCRHSPVDRWEATPLDDAVRSGHNAVAAFLRSVGAVALSMRHGDDDVSLSDERGSAAAGGSAAQQQAQLPDRKDSVEMAAMGGLLCSAAAFGHVEELRRLCLEEEGSADQADYDSRTPLHLAASEAQLETVRVLVDELRCRRSQPDRWGKTPLDDAEALAAQLREAGDGAAAGRYDQIVGYLTEKGAKRGSELTKHVQPTDVCALVAGGPRTL